MLILQLFHKKSLLAIILLFELIFVSHPLSAQSIIEALPSADRTITFSVSDTGECKPITWGLDLAWLSETNVRRGMAFMGKDNVDIIRSSFTPTSPLVNGNLATNEQNTLNARLSIIDLLPTQTQVVLNCDHPSVDTWFTGTPDSVAVRWARLIELTTRLHQEHGREVVSVSPFNEPDYSYTGQGTVTDFYNIAKELKQHEYMDSIRICGGNTLNCDQALSWYNNLKNYLDEGNTHQLAGSFDNYAKFYKTVRNNGDYATNDELHNVMEAMVGVEYGMQTGIWWGTATLARGEFVKISDGRRLGYAEHRNNWTAASVYRSTDGKVKAFMGESERQATTTSYRFISTDRDVFYDGKGPQREFIMEMPGGTGYQKNQPNAERVINITWGEDIQPIINGTYVLVNRKSKKAMQPANGSTSSGVNIQQSNINTKTYQKWNVTPVSSRVGGDFSYFSILNATNNKTLDICNWSLEENGSIILWDNSTSEIEQWYLDYAEDGWFYIRSRYNAKCLDTYNGSTASGVNIVQKDKVEGRLSQQWRFVPAGVTVEFTAPSAPQNLKLTSQPASIRIDWTPSDDAYSYTIARKSAQDDQYNIIAKNITENAFVDHTVKPGLSYSYKVKATDKAMNSSSYCREVATSINNEDTMIVHYTFENNTLDSTINQNHCSSYKTPTYTTGKEGSKSISFNGYSDFLQLPYGFANQEEMTITFWVYWTKGSSALSIFSFGCDNDQYMRMNPYLQFKIKNKDIEESMSSTINLSKSTWTHIALSIGDTITRLYVNGELSNKSTEFTIKPKDINPIINYIGKNRESNGYFGGSIDDFRVYNYALNQSKITDIINNTSVTSSPQTFATNNTIEVGPIPADNILNIVSTSPSRSVISAKLYNLAGQLVLSKTLPQQSNISLNVASVPTGIYLLNYNDGQQTIIKKIIIKH